MQENAVQMLCFSCSPNQKVFAKRPYVYIFVILIAVNLNFKKYSTIIFNPIKFYLKIICTILYKV